MERHAAGDDIAPHAAVLDHLLRNRHSCRAFSEDEVPRPVIKSVLDCAQRTPSWCNTQPWQVTILSGAAIHAFRAALLERVDSAQAAPDIAFPEAYRGVYQERRRACGLQLYEAVGVARGDREAAGRQARENFRLYGAPHVAIVTTDAALGQYGAVDCGAYVSTFMLTAQAHGVACIAQAALAAHAPFIRGWLGISGERRVICGISFGYEDAAHPANQFRTARAALAEAVDWRE
ncbi:nitroreductase [Paraburkholderia tropica]|uniref:nitroreductase n=1 Tax=Paraburkholderia tropica TaxID=92647 RepID=UPI002AB7E00C|nr:nitroreductase [Paraburkholderia tropica]